MVAANRRGRAGCPAQQGPIACVRQVLGHRETAWLLAALAIAILACIGWLTYFGAYAATDFGADANMLSALFLVAGAAEMVANNVAPVLLRCISALRMLEIGTLAFALNLLLTGVVYTSLETVFVAPTLARGREHGSHLLAWWVRLLGLLG
jgi:predicted MFS family arabinose efflux permease